MEYCKLQLGCLFVILSVVFVYFKDCRRFKIKRRNPLFAGILISGLVCVFFDGVTAYTVNHLDEVNEVCNGILHMIFLVSMDTFLFLLLLQMLSMTTGLPKLRSTTILLSIPYIINVIWIVVNIPQLEYRHGEITNYSMGMSAYTCFVMAGAYVVLTLAIFLSRWNYINRHKRISILTYLIVLVGVTGVQIIYPQALITSLGVAVMILGIYTNQENPAVEELTIYHNEMIMGFATLVENKDGSTGGHIKRTSMYVKLLTEELRKRGFYKDILTADYRRNLYLAAPMHDIGKISVPDVILQKPGKLTNEEFEIMKQHTVSGGKIIKETFGHLVDEEYTKMAYDVAYCHHEKWNGKGYPQGLKGEEIPLCARIMAIADVFDAVSEKRCYRDAMPLEQCFDIIQKGSGQDFDPMLVKVFMDIREKVILVYHGKKLSKKRREMKKVV